MIPEVKYPLYAQTLTKVAILYTIQKMNNHPTTQDACPLCSEPTTGAKSLSKHLLHKHATDPKYLLAGRVHIRDNAPIKWNTEQEFMDYIRVIGGTL